jgi:hypothetical protein
MRGSRLFVLYISLLCGLTLLSLLDADLRSRGAEEQVAQMRKQVAAWELTDLALFTEARYTRHLSQADYHTPFQDHPFALEHFPSGSLVMPPGLLLDQKP